MTSKYNFLYLEDHPEDVELLTETLAREYIPCEVSWVNGREAFESALTGGWGYDLILADFFLPDLQGEEALAIARQRCPGVPFIFLSGSLGEERAVECLRSGATDYVLKSHLARLAPVVRRALEEARMSNARREAEAATSRVVSLLRATLESTSEGILVVDLAGKISTYNRKFMSLCGIPDYVMAPMEMDRVLQFLRDQFQDPEAFLAEARLLGSQPGRESFSQIRLGDRVLEGSIRPNGLGSQKLGQVFSFRDVTAREKVTLQLEALVHTSQTLLDAAGAVGVVAWSLTADTLVMAPAADTVLGLPSGGRPKDLAGLEALIHPEEIDRFRQMLERPVKYPFELRLWKRDGWVWTSWSLERNPAGGYRGVFRDITGQRRQEHATDDQRRAQWMAYLADHTAQAIRRRLGRIRAPLDRARAAGPLAPDQAAAAQALARVETLLDQATLSVRCEPETSQPLELPALLEGFRVMAESRLPPGVRLAVRLEPGLPRLAMAPDHALQILMSLTRNARDAVHGAGTIEIGVSALPQPEAAPMLRIDVSDDGSGIPPGVRTRMFEPFFTTREDADGLGLAVVKNIVSAYRGSIEVGTTAGKGTTVTIVVPGTV